LVGRVFGLLQVGGGPMAVIPIDVMTHFVVEEVLNVEPPKVLWRELDIPPTTVPERGRAIPRIRLRDPVLDLVSPKAKTHVSSPRVEDDDTHTRSTNELC
jgi:hypothetical protein